MWCDRIATCRVKFLPLSTRWSRADFGETLWLLTRLSHLPASWPWENYWKALCLSFHICKRGMIKEPMYLLGQLCRLKAFIYVKLLEYCLVCDSLVSTLLFITVRGQIHKLSLSSCTYLHNDIIGLLWNNIYKANVIV